MDPVFEVHSPIFQSSSEAEDWVSEKARSVVSDVEMFKRMNVILDYIIARRREKEKSKSETKKEKLDIMGVYKGGTVFRLRIDFNFRKMDSQVIVLCDVGFSWISPRSKTRKSLASVKDLKNEFRQKKFWRAFSENQGSKILVRWDNKPYHDNAGTWPFHKHFGGQKVPASPSQEQSVVGFLEFVKAHLGNG